MKRLRWYLADYLFLMFDRADVWLGHAGCCGSLNRQYAFLWDDRRDDHRLVFPNLLYPLVSWSVLNSRDKDRP